MKTQETFMESYKTSNQANTEGKVNLYKLELTYIIEEFYFLLAEQQKHKKSLCRDIFEQKFMFYFDM